MHMADAGGSSGFCLVGVRSAAIPVQFVDSQPVQVYHGLPVSTSMRSDDFDSMV